MYLNTEMMGKEYVNLCKTAYDLCMIMKEHPLFDVGRCLMLHCSYDDFLSSIFVENKSNPIERLGGAPNYSKKEKFHLYKKGKENEGYDLELFEDENGNSIFRNTNDQSPANMGSIQSLIQDVCKKTAEFDWRLALLNNNVFEEEGYHLTDIISAYKETSEFYSLLKQKKGLLYRKTIRQEYLARLVVDIYLNEGYQPTSPFEIDFLKLLTDKENEKFKYDPVVLLMLILSALPAFQKKATSGDCLQSFQTIVNFLKNYFQGKSLFDQLPELIKAEELIKMSLDNQDLLITKVKMIACVKDIFNEYDNLTSSHYKMDLNDENRAEHEHFCEKYDIEGLWMEKTQTGEHYWNIQKMGDYCVVHEFLNFGGDTVSYKRYTLIIRLEASSTAFFTMVPAAEVQKIFNHGNMDTDAIMSNEVQLKIQKKYINKSLVETVCKIEVEDPSADKHLPFCHLERVSDDIAKEYKIFWEKAKSHHTEAAYSFCLTLTAITAEYIYIGSFDRDLDGYCSFFYQLSRSACEKLFGDSLYYTDFCQPVGIIRSYQNNEFRDYLANDALGYYVDVTDIEHHPIDGIKIIPRPLLTDFLQLDSQKKLYPKDLNDNGIFSPFHYSERHKSLLKRI